MSTYRNYEPKGVIPAALLPFHADLSIDDAALKIGAAGFIVTFMFVYEPALLMIGRAVENRVYERATEELVNAIDALGTYWERQNDALQESARRVAREREIAVMSAGEAMFAGESTPVATR